jgi:hypothetical protein
MRSCSPGSRHLSFPTVIGAACLEAYLRGDATPAGPVAAEERMAFLACANSFVFDYCVRQKASGSHLGWFVLKQVPLPSPEMLRRACPWDEEVSQIAWLSDRAIELTWTSHDLDMIADDEPQLGGPFRWDSTRGAAIRAELDAAMLRLYGLEGSDAQLVLDSLGVARKHDGVEHGEFRTKRLVLERYDAMAEATGCGVPHETILDPPPGDRRATHAAQLAGRADR